ncbi:hypothetical protein POSPLADRAFT_1164419 [Postia placenta MAD-698-R-SB12]|uniref:Cytochrome P450 monooxygenase 110 n=2 Tax=Rhodonia placenta TaxID=104341 RepID=CY110_POSPM|nr:hypothetical protein POSPLADRAFT_1164419 [Postia placenta MAD-698-R-SB12]F1SY99.1 RecName: Full=Cytochrome P450 monooxygenase 110 [Postia placenta Mad-698-R]OSX67134.1 hypothetical protein POSPLADRAFT_1164419 [Postia placenta MAD-698-R-SB12]BAK09443.1 cytochrome P450 [Postia placenta]
MEDKAQYVFALLGILATLYFVRWSTDPLRHIPAIGPSAPIVSYLSAYRYCRNAQSILQEGYHKYKVFRVSLVDRWVVVVSGADMNEELRKVPDTHVSFQEAADDLIQLKYTIAPDVNEHPIHTPVIRGPLTRNLGALFPDVVDEINVAFPELMPPAAKRGDWVAVSVRDTMGRIVSRASNRIFVGLPLCRNPDYLKTVVEFAFSVAKSRTIINAAPAVFRPIVGHFLPWAKRAVRNAGVHVKPLIRLRVSKMQDAGDDQTDKSCDYLMWLIEEAQKTKQNLDIVVQGILVSNFAAIHTSSNSITHSLLNLAAYPQHVQPLREEIEGIIKEYGWTKEAIGKMWKLDSFMRESQRLSGISGISVMRKVLQDITLSDGTYLPKGTLVVAAAFATHTDERYYENPEVFEPFRFYDMRTENDALRKQYVNTSREFITFGHGKHACPGRFFAVNELKAMMAYIILHYDVKLEEGVSRPENVWIWHNISPASTKVLFRERQSKVQ